MNFTKEQREILKQYEDRLNTAYNLNYVRGLTYKASDAILGVWREVKGKDENVNFSCSHCVLSFMKKVGKMYFEDLAEIAKANEMVKVLDEVMAEVPDPKEPEPKPKKPAATKKSTKKATKKATKK